MDLIKIFPLPPTPTSQMFLPILISSGTWHCWLFYVEFWDVNIYIKYVFISKSSVGEYLFQEKTEFHLYLIFIFFRESSSAMLKTWSANNCNFATELGSDLLFRSWLFPEDSFLTQAGVPSRCPNFWRFSLLPNPQLPALPQCFSSSVPGVVVVAAHVPSGRFAFRNIHN